MTLARLKPYESQLQADADETIALRQQLADCCPELTIRKAALLGMFAGGLLGFAAAWVAWSVTG